MMQSEIDKSKLYYLRRPKDRNFFPEDFLTPGIEKDQYGVHEKLYLRFDARLLWFWDVYPDGQISFEGEPVSIKDGVYSSTVHLFADQESKKRGYSLSSAKACKKVTGEDIDDRIAMAVQSQAIANALKRAGFVILIPDKGFHGDDIIAEIENENMVYLNPEEGEKIITEPQNSAAEGEKTAEDNTEDKVLSAMNMVCPIGSKRGMTLREIMINDPSFITWIINRADNLPDLKDAAKLLLEHAVKKNQ